MNEQTEFHIKPELPIGTEFWYMYNNKICLALVAAIKVYITSATDSNRGWKEQLFLRWMKKTAKQEWKYSYSYELKLDDSIIALPLEKKKDGWYILDRKCFFTEQELKDSL